MSSLGHVSTCNLQPSTFNSTALLPDCVHTHGCVAIYSSVSSLTYLPSAKSTMLKLLCGLIVVAFSLPTLASDVGIRIRFGLTDKEPTKWDGTISIAPGKIERIDGWRFQDGDEVHETTGWKASTRPLTVRRSNNAK